MPDLALYSLAYGLSTNLITQKLGSYKTEWSKNLTHLKLELRAAQAHDDKNIKTITERGGESYALQQHNEHLHEIRMVVDRIAVLSEIQKIWQKSHGNIYNIGKYYLFGWQVFAKSLPYECRWTIHETLSGMDPAFNWVEENNDKVNNVLVLAERINQFINESNRVIGSVSNLFYTSNDNSLILKGISLCAEKDTLLEPSDYIFEMGKRYLLQGASGNGKSIVLSKIRGLVDAGGITSQGEISLPGGKKMRLLAQSDFFAQHKTLREALYYPETTSLASLEEDRLFIEKAVNLLVEMRFKDKDARSSIESLLDKKGDLYALLSGGQKKKVQIVAEIMKKPDILILDESLNGLDQVSREITIKIIKRELPEAMIIVVDHKGGDENFYDHCIKFDNHNLREVGLQQLGGAKSR